MARESIDYFKMWLEDKQWILSCMIQNMCDDLAAGYDYYGNSIKTQRGEIDAYKFLMDEQIEMLKNMDEKKVNHWCKLDLVKRGAIEL